MSVAPRQVPSDHRALLSTTVVPNYRPIRWPLVAAGRLVRSGERRRAKTPTSDFFPPAGVVNMAGGIGPGSRFVPRRAQKNQSRTLIQLPNNSWYTEDTKAAGAKQMLSDRAVLAGRPSFCQFGARRATKQPFKLARLQHAQKSVTQIITFEGGAFTAARSAPPRDPRDSRSIHEGAGHVDGRLCLRRPFKRTLEPAVTKRSMTKTCANP